MVVNLWRRQRSRRTQGIEDHLPQAAIGHDSSDRLLTSDHASRVGDNRCSIWWLRDISLAPYLLLLGVIYACNILTLSILIWWTDLTRHILSAAQASHGRMGSCAIRSAARNAFLWEVRDQLIALSREGVLGKTLRERAEQLNARGVRSTRGKLLDPQKLSPALIALGADANSVKLLHKKAVDAADEFGVDPAEMVDQLWHEWLYHHTLIMIEYGVTFDANHKHPFRFKPIRPFEWSKNHPGLRDSRVTNWWYGKRMVLPPQAQLVYALFGMFFYRKVSLKKRRNQYMVYFP
ncbi:MAG: hypothetical protein R3E14_09330 [Erythrobacter sp.]